MICTHPDCTGVHDGKRPMAEWCPALRDSHRRTTREAQRRYAATAAGLLAEVRANANRRGTR